VEGWREKRSVGVEGKERCRDGGKREVYGGGKREV
jgi:hypothetical protein